MLLAALQLYGCGVKKLKTVLVSSGYQVKPLHTQKGNGAETSTSLYEEIMMVEEHIKTLKRF